MRVPVDSAKKKPHKRLVSGGVAERLRRLSQRERSEVTFWEHKTRSLKEEEDTTCTSEYIILVL